MAKVVDWDKTLEQVQGDEVFLHEVFGDLITEAKDARREIAEAIASANWKVVAKAAHRVKGSSAYLYCEQMRVCSLNLQDLGQKGTNAPPEQIDEIARSITEWFNDFTDSVQRVETEVIARYGSVGGEPGGK